MPRWDAIIRATMNLTKQLRNLADMLIVTVVLLLLIEVVSLVIIAAYAALASDDAIKTSNKPNHGVEQAQVFAESRLLQKYGYKSFVGWQAKPAQGEWVNINAQGRRVTGAEEAFPDSPTVHLFGGSTMWGTGVADDGTIPALLAPKISQNTINYGDKGFNSRQNLNRMIDNLADMSPGDTVIFYDGVNDSIQNCRSDNSPDGHSREGQIKGLLEENDSPRFSVAAAKLFRLTNTYALLQKGMKRLGPSRDNAKPNVSSTCGDPAIAQQVAEFLVQNWRAAQDILQSREINFICALQPNPYTATGFEPEYHMAGRETSVHGVYPLVQDLAVSEGLACFADMTQAFDQDYYLDNCCHVNRDGNAVMAARIETELNTREQR